MSKRPDFAAIREQIESTVEVLSDGRFPLEELYDFDTNGYYATSECLAGECGFPKIWFGKCIAQYRNVYLRKVLRRYGVEV